MSWRRMASMGWPAAAALLFLAGPAFGAGFGIFEQGAKAMGMAGAFTAQADDPSLLWHNAGGLAFVNRSSFALGATWIHSTKADFHGAAPFPGPGVHEEQKALSAFPPHAYYVAPINDTWKWGIGVETPFGLTTEWKNENDFAGRFLSTKAALQAFDVNPTIGWQVTPSFGIGVGAIARFSKVELNRHVGIINPFTFGAADIGKVKLTSDYGTAYGFNVGLLAKPTPFLSLGASYRSKMTVDYEGDARFTQISTGNAQLDAAAAQQVPFGTKLPIKTSIDFPDMVSVGVAYSFTPSVLVEVDANRTFWSSFEEVVISGRNATASAIFADSGVIPQKWEDANNYRLGVRLGQSNGSQLRLGYVYDETPQPEASINPLLPDANRNGFTIGYGTPGPGFTWDVALMYLKFQERSRNVTRQGEPPFYGTYNTTAWLVGLTLGWR